MIRNLANLLKSLGRFEEAIDLIKKAVVLDPKRVPVFTSLGLLSMYANHLEDAAAAYQKAIEETGVNKNAIIVITSYSIHYTKLYDVISLTLSTFAKCGAE